MRGTADIGKALLHDKFPSSVCFADSFPQGKPKACRTPDPLRSKGTGFSHPLVDSLGRFPKEGKPQFPLLWPLREGVQGERFVGP